jgi:alkylhydroperoxidase family enzyme
VLRKNFFQVEQLISIVKDFRNADLSSEEVALMAFAQKITLDAAQVDESDFDELRRFGLSDQEILDVVVTCTARNFFSKTLDSLDVEPDAIYNDMEPELLKTLILGRPF